MSAAAAPNTPAVPGLRKELLLTVPQFLLHFYDRHRLPRKARPFCFILGAGASVQSGIPAARTLIDEWLAQLHRAAGSPLPIEQWATSQNLNIPGFIYKQREEKYAELFDLRYQHHPDDGLLFLQEKMSRSRPSYGYAVLAQLLSGEHRIIITTNFDNLASDALFQFGSEPPFICGHETLAGYIPSRTTRPVIIKIHRDLLTAPINDADGVSHLHEAWHRPMQEIFQHYTPVFLGYGGNDGSLMTFLESLPLGTPDHIYWCQYRRDQPAHRVVQYLNITNGRLVLIDGFDQLMAALHRHLELEDPVKALEAENQNRLTHLRKSQDALTDTARADVAAAEKETSPDSPETLAARFDLADALYDKGDYRAAETELRSIFETCSRIFGPEHSDTLRSRNNLANALWAQGKNAEAEQEHRTAQALYQRVLGPEHPNTLASRNNYAEALRVKGRHAEAEKEHRAVLALRQRVLGPEHHETLSSRQNLATALQAQGKNEDAEQEHRAVLGVLERVLGPEHPNTLISWNNLAGALGMQRKNTEAEQVFRRVLAVRLRLLGLEHPDTLQSHRNLALCLTKLGLRAWEGGDKERARELWWEGLELARVAGDVGERGLGAEHHETLASRNNLSLCLGMLGQERWEAGEKERAREIWREGLEQAQVARDVGARVLGAEHPDQKKYERQVRDLEALLAQ